MITIYGLVSNNEPNNIKYVGITRRNPFNRLKSHKYDATKYPDQTPKTRWISENNCDIKLIILDEIEKEDDAFFWESHWISLIKSWGFTLVNSNNGGGGLLKRDEAFSEWLSKRSMGNKYNLGKRHTEETKRKISENQKGRISPNKGKKFSAETKLKQSLAKLGTKQSEETKNKRRKIVIQLTLDNKFIKEWPGLCLAAKELGILKGGISKACRKNKKYFGYKWIFK